MNKYLRIRAEESPSCLTATCVFILMLLFNTGAAQAEDHIAIEGYDPVAYFTALEAIKGSDSITHQWLDRTWYFTTEDNKALFVSDPIKYMPNYGGYCSYDPMKLGHDHEVDPTAWRIVNDKLYLFYSEMTANEKLATKEWVKVKAGLSQ